MNTALQRGTAHPGLGATRSGGSSTPTGRVGGANGIEVLRAAGSRCCARRPRDRHAELGCAGNGAGRRRCRRGHDTARASVHRARGASSEAAGTGLCLACGPEGTVRGKLLRTPHARHWWDGRATAERVRLGGDGRRAGRAGVCGARSCHRSRGPRRGASGGGRRCSEVRGLRGLRAGEERPSGSCCEAWHDMSRDKGRLRSPHHGRRHLALPPGWCHQRPQSHRLLQRPGREARAIAAPIRRTLPEANGGHQLVGRRRSHALSSSGSQ